MFKATKNKIVIGIILLFIIGCTKNENQNDSDSVAGTYIGNTVEENTWSSPENGIVEKDTTYVDTFIVEITPDNDILFMNKGYQWMFKVDPSNKYEEYDGPHTARVFRLNVQDSLRVTYWNWSGWLDTYHQTDKNFNGEKQ